MIPVPFGEITEFRPFVIVGWYVLFYVSALAITAVGRRIYERSQTVVMDSDPDFSYREVILAGPIEEMLYRGIPVGIAYHTLELSQTGVFFVLMLANGVWSGSHHRDFGAFTFTFVLGLFLTKFWLSGFDGLWWMAIVAHSIHNIFVTWVGDQLSDGVEIDPRHKPKPQ